MLILRRGGVDGAPAPHVGALSTPVMQEGIRNKVQQSLHHHASHQWEARRPSTFGGWGTAWTARPTVWHSGWTALRRGPRREGQ